MILNSFRIILILLFFITPAKAVEPSEILGDPALEARARAISKELRCLVCQNQSIDDSDAPMAKDLRVLVRERLQAGDTDDAVRTFLVNRFGNYVLLEPPVQKSTWLLWAGPFLVLALGGALGFMLTRNKRAEEFVPLSEEDQKRVDAFRNRS